MHHHHDDLCEHPSKPFKAHILLVRMSPYELQETVKYGSCNLQLTQGTSATYRLVDNKVLYRGMDPATYWVEVEPL
jgi:hypothetical protein